MTLVGAFSLPAFLVDWWPIALVVGGLVLTTLGFAVRRPAAVAPAPAQEGFEDLPPAPGASVLTDLPAAETTPVAPAPASSVPAAPSTAEGDVDIYKVIEDQP